MENSTSYEIVRSYVTPLIRQAMELVSLADREKLSEVRIRSGQAVSFVYPDKIAFLTRTGKIQTDPVGGTVVSTAEDIRNIVRALSRFSVHSKSRELTQGYFVIEHGIRVGVSGVLSATDPPVFRSFTGLNFRLSREIPGCASEIFRLMSRNFGSVLICGEVNSGKTTVLRDLCRQCSQRWKVTLIDERSEIAFSGEQGTGCDVGPMTDVLTGCSRSSGITMAVRTLSPDLIFCDEIATQSDSDAMIRAAGCGVRFAATIHAGSFSDLQCRPISAQLLSAGIFTHGIFLCGSSFPGKIAEIRRLSNA